MSAPREGNLQAPTRHPLDWKNPDFYNTDALFHELERVYDICHGCRRCVSLCQAFPTLFDLVDNAANMEVSGVTREDYWKVVDHCYLCDLCYLTKCPYVPPHEWNLDFPHLMLRAKAVKFKRGEVQRRDRVISSTDRLGKWIARPAVSQLVNAVNRTQVGREILEEVLGVHRDAPLPAYHSKTLRQRLAQHQDVNSKGEPAGRTTGKVALFTTCYGNYNAPNIGEDLVAILRHNGIPLILPEREQCCGMPKLELGDLAAVARAKEANIPVLSKLVDAGWDVLAVVPSCVLMFKQELPLMFPDDAQVQNVKAHIFDPFEYLMLRHKHGKLKTDFKQPLGKVAYHAACHQRVQNIGQKTRELLALIPDSQIEIIERCSGHDGTYALKKEFHATAQKILRPVSNKVQQIQADHYGSDCPMAGVHIAHGLKDGSTPQHPLSLLRKAYGL